MANTKRKNGEGSYGHTTIKGVEYKIYTAPNHAWRVYARTAKELEEKRRQKEREFHDKELLRAPMIVTLENVCDEWLQNVKSKVSARTYDDYEMIVEKRLKQSTDLIKTQAAALSVRVLNQYINSLKDQYAHSTISKTWIILRQAVEYGQKNKYIPERLNLDEVTLPRKDATVKGREVQFITPSDMEILYNETKKKADDGTAVYGNGSKVIVFIMYSGIRLGESIALKWRDVSPDLKEITIRHSQTRIKKRDGEGNVITDKDGKAVYEARIKAPKTESGENRIIPLPKRGIEVLEYFSNLYPDHRPEDNVFRTKNGTAFNPTNLQHTLKRLLKSTDCACKDYTPHSLRHGYGSYLLAKGVEINTVSKLLGHKKTSTTYNIYIHLLEDDKKKAVRQAFDGIDEE